jgi:superfamily II RNA helicase
MVIVCDANKYDGDDGGDDFTYPFELSPFQKHAIHHIRRGNHVLITAHTGSGKTLPAEFAIEHFFRAGKKVVYTSPIKALSNQKYADFSRKYPHISFGLLTGDIKTNPDAQVLIMTTEILMNALFHRAPAFQLDELGCVVFDEIHYINDMERGHVWEKTILMLPDYVQMVMLSATIDAPERFAAWIETTTKSTKKVVLASTGHRVVPLTHYAYVTLPESGLKNFDKTTEKMIRESTHDLTPWLDNKCTLIEANYHKTQKLLKMFQDYDIRTPRKFVLNQLLLFLRDRTMLPAIFFVFSRKMVETCAQEITVPLLEDDSKVGYIVARECEQILRKLSNFHEYMQMPEYRLVVSLLEKGIGIHHSGMIPILREMVELMIAKKYIKVLFATESFAIGLDCPIKTAVFTSLTKFDGQRERLLYAHEYTQMAGRAGRRGIDTHGYVVHCCNLFQTMPTANDYRELLSGKPQQLVSKFGISYNLVLNLLKSGGSLSVEDCCVFVNQSMRRQDMDQVLTQRKAQLNSKSLEREKMRAALETTMKTPMQACLVYLDMERALPFAVNKKRKALDRDMKLMVEQHPTCLADVQRVRAFQVLDFEVQQILAELSHLQAYMLHQMQRVCLLLETEGFLASSDDKLSLTTPLGTAAAGLAEIHPLIMARVLCDSNWFNDVGDVAQLVGILSCFTDVKVLDRLERPAVHGDDAVVQKYATQFVAEHRRLCALEEDAQLVTSEVVLNFDLIAWAMRWASRCDDEVACRIFLMELHGKLGVSAGDFTKAMLKVSTVAKELSGIAEAHAQTECLHKLSLVDAAILKYVATNQSLYV